jgi:branched-chain amino acid transport system substrate-binding protein
MKRHIFYRILIATFAILALAGCGDSSPVLIGFSGQLTGQMSDLGVYGRNGATLAIENINSAGGIHGQPLKLIAKDDMNTPDGALQADFELIEAGVAAIIGHMTSSQTEAVLPFVSEQGVVMISPTTSSPKLSGKTDSFFRTISENSSQSKELAKYAHSTLALKTIVAVSDVANKSYSLTFADNFESVFTNHGGKMLAKLTYSSNDPQIWDSIANSVINLQPDGLLLICSAHDAVAIAQRIRPQDSKIRLLSGAWAYTNELIKWGDEYVEGMTFVIDYTADNPNPEFIKFRESYKNRFGKTPNFASAFTYEATLALAEGLKKTGGSREGLADAMAPSRTINGVIGPFKLNEYGDVMRNIFIVTVQNSTFRTMEMR